METSEIRNRIAVERAKRLRADGTQQYEYMEHPEDPWADQESREPVHDDVGVTILGAGMSGLTCAVELRKAGYSGSIRLLDRASDVGGTWYWNRYPGAQCDVESYIYLPLLEEMGYMPTERYVHQPEILDYFRSIASAYDLYPDALFQTEAAHIDWDESLSKWRIRTDRDDDFTTRFLVLAGGFLQRPKLPRIPGIDEFEGVMFHSSRWDYSYTGGHPGKDGGGLPRLSDKKVGLVGTGATGLQIVTPLAHAAEDLLVFQRTPAVVLPRDNRPTDEAWADGLEPGWQRDRMRAFNLAQGGQSDCAELFNDGWTNVVFKVGAAHGAGLYGGPAEREAAERVDFAAMERYRERVREIVADAETAEALMPYFRMMCKRTSFHDEYLASFNLPNVRLVDTNGVGIERITREGVVVDGVEYKLDCLIFATGFDIGRGPLASWNLDVHGVRGVRLSEHWADGLRTYQGIHVSDFPNLFLNSVTQTPGAPNHTSNSVAVSEHIAHIIVEADSRGADRIMADVEAEEDWVQRVRAALPSAHIDFIRACTPGYYNHEGEDFDLPDVHFVGAEAFYEELRSWRDTGDLAGLTVRQSETELSAVNPGVAQA